MNYEQIKYEIKNLNSETKVNLLKFIIDELNPNLNIQEDMDIDVPMRRLHDIKNAHTETIDFDNSIKYFENILNK